MTINKLAIIGGSGLYDVEQFKNREFIQLDTPWGKPSDQILKTTYNKKDIYFLEKLPSEISFFSILIIFILSITVSAIASYIPAMTISKMKTFRALKYE